jgi:hypothetical protein
VNIGWDATRYADRLPRMPSRSGTVGGLKMEACLNGRYPPRNNSTAEVHISRPCIIVDKHGVILAWHLPGILKDSRQVSLFTLSDHCIKYVSE